MVGAWACGRGIKAVKRAPIRKENGNFGPLCAPKSLAACGTGWLALHVQRAAFGADQPPLIGCKFGPAVQMAMRADGVGNLAVYRPPPQKIGQLPCHCPPFAHRPL